MASALRFDDPAHQSQMVFRAVMTAMSRPGRIEAIATLHARGPLPGCMAEIALALCDFETPVWLDPALHAAAGVVEWFRFQTGSPIVERPDEAAFAFVVDPDAAPELDSLGVGTEEYPERSTTLVLNVDRLSDEGGFSLIGPGVKGAARLGVHPVRPGLIAERAGLFELFPRGVDLIFVCGARIAALPRTTIVEG